MALLPEHVSAVLVTKGDVDLKPIVDSLPFDDVVVWNNLDMDLKVFGRYMAIRRAKHSIIYTQDDDCIVDAAAIVAAYEPGYIVANMSAEKRREYDSLAPHVALLGWGSCFDAAATDGAFQAYVRRYGHDELLNRECDRIFTSTRPKKLVDVPVKHLPHAFAGRMGNERRHLADLAEIQRRIATL